MSAARGTARGLCLVIAAFCIASGLDARRADSRKVDTSFGYVLVDPKDVAAAIAEGDAAQEAARRVLLLCDVRMVIVEEGYGRWGSVRNGHVVYPWPFPNGARRLSARPATHVLRHEIGHDLLARHLVPKSRQDQYGTDAPDWLDEMAAIAFEGASQQSERRRGARIVARGSGLLPISTLMAMTHPEFRSGPAVDGSGTIVTSLPSSDDTIRFYVTVQAFYDYLLARTRNDAIVADIAHAFRRGDDPASWTARRAGLAEGPDPAARLDADFRRWLAGDTRYAGR